MVTPESVPKVGDGMALPQSVATVSMMATTVQAMDVEDWATSTNTIGQNAQAAFSLLAGDTVAENKWMGFADGRWVELIAQDASATDGVYDVTIDLDYSLGSDHRKIRYSIRPAGEGDFIRLKPENSQSDWLDIGKDATVIAGVDVYGYVTTGDVYARAGTRQVEGEIAKAEDISMSYDKMQLYVLATNTWAVTNVRVTVHTAAGESVLNSAYAAGATNAFDLSSIVKAGGDYTYDIALEGAYESTPITSKTENANPVKMYSTGSWFYFDGGNDDFVHATTNGNISIADGKFFATDEDSATEGTITPTNTPANVGTVVTTTMNIAGVCTDLSDYTGDNIPQFAIALGGTSAEPVWKYCSNGVWVSSAATPVTNGIYEGRATFDYTNSVVKYEIRPAGAAAFVELAPYIPLPSDKTSLAAVAIRGGGSVSALDATLKLAAPQPTVVDPNVNTIVVTKNTAISVEELIADKAYTVEATPGAHLTWKDAGGKYAKVVNGNQLQIVNGTPANGLKSYNSYVLGLDPTVATDKPAAIVKPNGAVAGDTPKMTVYVPNVKPRDDTGCKPMLQLQRKNGDGWVNYGDPVEVNADVQIPMDGEVYRVNTIIK